MEEIRKEVESERRMKRRQKKTSRRRCSDEDDGGKRDGRKEMSIKREKEWRKGQGMR